MQLLEKLALINYQAYLKELILQDKNPTNRLL